MDKRYIDFRDKLFGLIIATAFLAWAIWAIMLLAGYWAVMDMGVIVAVSALVVLFLYTAAK